MNKPLRNAAATEQAEISGPRWKLALRYGVSIALIAYLVSLLDIGLVRVVLLSSNPYLLAGVVVVFALERTLGAYRWYLLLSAIHASIPWRIVFKATFISGFFGNFVPGIVGTEVVRIATISRSTRNLGAAVSTVAFDRTIGSLALAAIALLAALAAPADIPTAIRTSAASLLVLFGLGLLAVTNARTRPVVLGAVHRGSPAIIRHRLDRLLLGVELIARRHRMLAASILLAFVFQLMRIAAVVVGAHALGYDIALIHFLLYVPVILVVMMIPVSLGGLGVREAGFVYFFGAALMPAEAAFTLSLIIYGGSVVAQLPGLLFWLQGIEVHRE